MKLNYEVELGAVKIGLEMAKGAKAAHEDSKDACGEGSSSVPTAPGNRLAGLCMAGVRVGGLAAGVAE